MRFARAVSAGRSIRGSSPVARRFARRADRGASAPARRRAAPRAAPSRPRARRASRAARSCPAGDELDLERVGRAEPLATPAPTARRGCSPRRGPRTSRRRAGAVIRHRGDGDERGRRAPRRSAGAPRGRAGRARARGCRARDVRRGRRREAQQRDGSTVKERTSDAPTPNAAATPKRANASSSLGTKERKPPIVVSVIMRHGAPTSSTARSARSERRRLVPRLLGARRREARDQVQPVAGADHEHDRRQDLGERVLRPAEPAEEPVGPEHADADRPEERGRRRRRAQEQREPTATSATISGTRRRVAALELAARDDELDRPADRVEREALRLEGRDGALDRAPDRDGRLAPRVRDLDERARRCGRPPRRARRARAGRSARARRAPRGRARARRSRRSAAGAAAAAAGPGSGRRSRLAGSRRGARPARRATARLTVARHLERGAVEDARARRRALARVDERQREAALEAREEGVERRTEGCSAPRKAR